MYIPLEGRLEREESFFLYQECKKIKKLIAEGKKKHPAVSV